MIVTEKRFSKRKLFFQFFKFGIVGVFNTAVNASFYWTFLFILGEGSLIASNISAWVFSVFIGHVVQKRFVFKGKLQFGQVIRTYLAYSISLVIGTSIMWLAVNMLGVPERWAVFTHMPITVPLNFVLNKIWANQEKWSDG